MKKEQLLIASLISVLLTNCSVPHYYYSPNTQNVPLFSEPNEFSGLIAGSIGTVNPSIELQAGYAFPKGIALTANYMTGGNDNSKAGVTDNSKNNYFEGALGYYKSFAKIGVFEIFGGYGHGSQKHEFARKDYRGGFVWEWVEDGNAELSFSKLFIQPDIGIKVNWLEASFSTRLSKLNYNTIVANNTLTHQDELTLLKQNSAPFLVEPAFTFRAGAESVKAEMQIGFSTNMTNSNLKFEQARFTIGLHFNISKQIQEN